MDKYIGIDIHAASCTIALVDARGKDPIMAPDVRLPWTAGHENQQAPVQSPALWVAQAAA